MNKKELVEAIAKKTGISKKDTKAIVSAFEEVVIETIAAGGEVKLLGFGTFKVVDRSARKGRNLSTGEAIDIPATKGVKFAPGTELKACVKVK